MNIPNVFPGKAQSAEKVDYWYKDWDVSRKDGLLQVSGKLFDVQLLKDQRLLFKVDATNTGQAEDYFFNNEPIRFYEPKHYDRSGKQIGGGANWTAQNSAEAYAAVQKFFVKGSSIGVSKFLSPPQGERQSDPWQQIVWRNN